MQELQSLYTDYCRFLQVQAFPPSNLAQQMEVDSAPNTA
jgi:hypothetical protein